MKGGDKGCVLSLKCGREIRSLELKKIVCTRMKAGSVIIEGF